MKHREFKHTVELPHALGDCPTWWINFVEYVENIPRYDVNNSEEHINNELKLHNGYFAKIAPHQFYVSFILKEDATAFILRFL